MIDKILFGQYLAKRRKELGMTQSTLAEKLHISFQAVSKWERGVSIPDRDTIGYLAKLLNISGGWFALESASSFSLNQLVYNVNEKGITGKNYLGLGAMIMSDGFSSKTIMKFTDQKIRDSLSEVLKNRTEWNKMSLVSLSHHFCNIYATHLDDSFITSRLQDTNGITTCAIQSELGIPYIVMSKVMKQVAERYSPCTILVSNKYDETEDLQIEVVCSHDMGEQGFNCSYLRSLLESAIFQPSIVTGASGGGNMENASLIIRKPEMIALLNNYFLKTRDIFLNYALLYNKPFEVVLVEKYQFSVVEWHGSL